MFISARSQFMRFRDLKASFFESPGLNDVHDADGCGAGRYQASRPQLLQ